MAIVLTQYLKPGAILAEEVRDVSGRLLLSRGKKIKPQHLRIFKIWGITEVHVAEEAEAARHDDPSDLDPETLQEIREQTAELFAYTDLNHPALKEIYRLAVQFRGQQQVAAKIDLPICLKNDDDSTSCPQKELMPELIRKNITLPEIPNIVFELNEVIANPLSSANDIARVVNRSPSLTAILLRIVNSSFYGFPSRIDKVSLAVTLIGTREISGLALGISILSMFREIPKEFVDMYSFLKHSLACGILSRVLAAQKNLPQTEQLFVSGLLHDLGRLIIYIHFPKEARQLFARCNRSGSLLHEAERDFLGCDHSDIGKQLMKQWKLPLTLENNVFYHHRPSAAQFPETAAIVHLADIMINALGIGTSGERFVPPLDVSAWESLALSPGCFEVVLKQATHQFFALESILYR
jgi:HD-like signal output (HDOD) protein